jgi:hypothetical protein
VDSGLSWTLLTCARMRLHRKSLKNNLDFGTVAGQTMQSNSRSNFMHCWSATVCCSALHNLLAMIVQYD